MADIYSKIRQREEQEPERITEDKLYLLAAGGDAAKALQMKEGFELKKIREQKAAQEGKDVQTVKDKWNEANALAVHIKAQAERQKMNIEDVISFAQKNPEFQDIATKDPTDAAVITFFQKQAPENVQKYRLAYDWHRALTKANAYRQSLQDRGYDIDINTGELIKIGKSSRGKSSRRDNLKPIGGSKGAKKIIQEGRMSEYLAE